jgi:hypothetical protein
MTVTSGVSGRLARVSSAVSPKRFSVSPSVSASRGNSYQELSGSFFREKEERDQIDPQSSIPRTRALRPFHRARFTVAKRVSVTSVPRREPLAEKQQLAPEQPGAC